MRLGLFGKGPRADAGKALSERLKGETRELLGLPQDAVIAVNEIICADPACPGTETVVLVMNPGEKTRAFKLSMAMAEVTRDALAEVLAASRSDS